MEAACVAAARGHAVTLWERSDRLGGALNWAAQMPLRQEFSTLLDHQKARLGSAGVDVCFETEATPERLAQFAPDRVVWATGADPIGQDMDGGGRALTLETALSDPEVLGPSVVLVDHLGGWSVVSVAEYLADLGKAVTLVAPSGTPGWTISMYSSFALRDRLRDKSVRIIGHHTLIGHQDGVATLRDLTLNASQIVVPATSVVAPLQGRPHIAAQAPANGISHQIAVGDCLSTRSALEAVFEGHEAGRAI